MNNQNLIPYIAVAVGAVVLLNKAKAQVAAPAGSKSTPVPNTSVNGQMWTSLLGQGWKALTDAKNSDGTQAFLMTNGWGQIVTSDGKPVGQEMADLFPATYGSTLPVDTAMGGHDYMTDLFGTW